MTNALMEQDMNEREKCAEILARHETSDAANMRSSYRDRIIDALLEARALASRDALELALLALLAFERNPTKPSGRIPHLSQMQRH